MIIDFSTHWGHSLILVRLPRLNPAGEFSGAAGDAFFLDLLDQFAKVVRLALMLLGGG